MTHRTPRIWPLLAALTLVIGAACTASSEREAAVGETADSAPALPDGVEARSFLGDELRAPELSEAARTVYEERYAEAERALEAAPDDVDSLIWMGRRTAYLGRFRDAIDIYTHALTLHPDDPRLYRHRGHRWITVREPVRAIEDFDRADALTRGQPDEVEPDGLPNERGIPTSTLQFNIHYHRALAYYLAGDFDAARDAYARCAEVSEHADSKVATAYWRTLTLLRTGRDAEARAVMADITPGMDVIEGGGYLDLVLLFKGERTPSDLLGGEGADASLAGTTTAYGVGMWYLLNGQEERAREIFASILENRSQWAAFGYIAAEAEIAGLGDR